MGDSHEADGIQYQNVADVLIRHYNENFRQTFDSIAEIRC